MVGRVERSANRARRVHVALGLVEGVLSHNLATDFHGNRERQVLIEIAQEHRTARFGDRARQRTTNVPNSLDEHCAIAQRSETILA